jgi:protoporphyrinogen IX oxidase
MYNTIKALHIIFIVTWFSGLFYIVRLFVYHAEAAETPEPARTILQNQYRVMIRRLWLGIAWPSAILTLIFGPWMWWMMGSLPTWLLVKLGFVLGLYGYHFSLHYIFRQQMRGVFAWSSQQLRIWNEVATVFLVAIVMLATVKDSMSWVRGLIGLLLFVVLLMGAIRAYKKIRGRNSSDNTMPK